jgi:hypothetical protein
VVDSRIHHESFRNAVELDLDGRIRITLGHVRPNVCRIRERIKPQAARGVIDAEVRSAASATKTFSVPATVRGSRSG